MLQKLLGHTTLMMTNRYCEAVGCYDAIDNTGTTCAGIYVGDREADILVMVPIRAMLGMAFGMK